LFRHCPLGRKNSAYEQIKEFIQASVPEFQLTPKPPFVGETAAVGLHSLRLSRDMRYNAGIRLPVF
jgi:hypothetical protein